MWNEIYYEYISILNILVIFSSVINLIIICDIECRLICNVLLSAN